MGRLFPNAPVVALTLLTLALAGCGSVHAGTGSPGGAASTSAVSSSPQSPQARARADAAAILAAFVPPPGASRLEVPAGIRSVVVTAVPGGNDKKKPPAPVTVTDPAKVRKLVELLNEQPTFPPGVHSCPFGDGRGLRLTFLTTAKGAVLATAFAAANGCGGVGLTVGTHQVGLGWGSGVAQQALTISGMNWKLFGYPPM